MSSFVSIFCTHQRFWKDEEFFTLILAESCSKNALAGLLFGRAKSLEVPQPKQDEKFKLVLVVDQMRRTKCFKTIGTRLVYLWRLVGSLVRVSCLQDPWTINHWLFFPLSWPWMSSKLRLEAHISKILILSFMEVSLKVSFYFLIGQAELSMHARHSFFSIFQPLVGPYLPLLVSPILSLF